ncbi:MAG: helix-turn-helix domain-containing protein [Thermoplasmata archaeon]
MREKDISRLLTDDYAERILVATHQRAKSVQEVSDRYDIPIAACYRKVHELEDAGFLRCSRIVTTPKGKAMKLYQATLKRAQLRFESGSFEVRFEFDHDSKMNGKWIELNAELN